MKVYDVASAKWAKIVGGGGAGAVVVPAICYVSFIYMYISFSSQHTSVET